MILIAGAWYLYKNKQWWFYYFSVVNCEVSKWSKWSSCDRSCGKGVQSRTRLIVQHPSPGGKRCPTLSQNRACLGNRCSTTYKKYKNPIVGKETRYTFCWSLKLLSQLIAEFESFHFLPTFKIYFVYVYSFIVVKKRKIRVSITKFANLNSNLKFKRKSKVMSCNSISPHYLITCELFLFVDAQIILNKMKSVFPRISS